MGFLTQPVSLQSIFGGARTVDDITMNVVINEHTTDTLTITKQPVATGASITDHAFLEPVQLTMTAYLQDNSFGSLINDLISPITGAENSLALLYDDLLNLQESRRPFSVITPKRDYDNMLLAILAMTTDKTTENCLSVTMTFQQIVLVPIATTTVPRRNLKAPAKNAATQAAGRKQSGIVKGINAGKALVGQ